MTGLDQLWAGWRLAYVSDAVGGPGLSTAKDECVFCSILAAVGSGELNDETARIVWRDDDVLVILNAYPYNNGHMLVMPVAHHGELDELDDRVADGLWSASRRAVSCLKRAYGCDGVNLGANLGRAAGAGIPGHLHVHVLPRWAGDTNFMTSIAEARVLPEAMGDTWTKLVAAWGG